MKRPNATLVGVPPPPPVRRSSPTLPAVPSIRAARSELAFSRTVVAPAPEAVPPELRAAVFVPPVPAAARAVAPPAPLPPERAPVAEPYPAPPVERTPAIAAAAFDVPMVAERPRPRFRTGHAVAVAVVGVAAGLGLSLFIGHRAREAPAAAVAAHPSPAPAASVRQTAPRKTEPTTVAQAPEQQAPPAQAPAAARESLEVPVSSTTLPSCREMLGREFVEMNDPKAALAETELANRELVRGNAHASQMSFCKAALWDAGKIERWLNLAQIFFIRRDDKQALDAAKRALELDATNARALELLGDAQARLGNLDGARRAYLDSERRPEPGSDARRWLVRRDMDEAQRSMRSRDFVRAERLFRRAVVFDPEHPGAALGVSTCLRKLENHAAADAWAKRAETLARTARKGT